MIRVTKFGLGLFVLGVVSGTPLVAISAGNTQTVPNETWHREIAEESFHSPDGKLSIHVSHWDPVTEGSFATVQLLSLPSKRVISILRVAEGQHFSVLWRPDGGAVAISFESGVSILSDKLRLFHVNPKGLSEVKIDNDLRIENFVTKDDAASGISFGLQRIAPDCWRANGDLVCGMAGSARLAGQKNGDMPTSGFIFVSYDVVLRFVGESKAEVVESKRTQFEKNE